MIDTTSRQGESFLLSLLREKLKKNLREQLEPLATEAKAKIDKDLDAIIEQTAKDLEVELKATRNDFNAEIKVILNIARK